jgi:hypothetical protein
MKVDEEGFRGMGYMCCGPWMSHGREGFRLTIGIMLILAGLIWFGARMEWIELTWIHAIPFWPVMITICGIWMVSRGLKTRKRLHSDHQKEG